MYNFQITKDYNTNSDIHKMNPLYKIICALIFTIIVLIVKETVMLLVLLVFVVILTALSNVPYKLYLRNIKFALPLMIFIVLINFIFNIPFSNTLNSILKLFLFIIYSGILIYTTKPNDLTYGLEEFLSPLKKLKIPVNSLALSISLSIRFIPIIFEQGEKILKSQLSRGLDFSGSLRTKANKLISIILPVFTLSLKRSDSIADTLEVKLYKPEMRRTKYREYKTLFVDDNILFMHLLIIFIYVFSEVLS
jgi:energy-coupling factor transport system permease protein